MTDTATDTTLPAPDDDEFARLASEYTTLLELAIVEAREINRRLDAVPRTGTASTA